MQLEARLRAFAGSTRHDSFSGAAAELRISQPAVSKHVADLERALGLKLVERARRDGGLTRAGDFIANHVLRAEALLAQADLGAMQFRNSGSGSLTIRRFVVDRHILATRAHRRVWASAPGG